MIFPDAAGRVDMYPAVLFRACSFGALVWHRGAKRVPSWGFRLREVLCTDSLSAAQLRACFLLCALYSVSVPGDELSAACAYLGLRGRVKPGRGLGKAAT